MSNYLIINLRRFGDVISTSHIIHSIKEQDPNSHICLLTYEETNRASKIIKDVDEIYTINRKQIASQRKNKIFSNAFALSTLEESLRPVQSKNWDHIINYSNDKVGSYLATYLKNYNCEIHGTYFDGNIVQQSNDWSIVFNDVLTSYRYPCVHFQECYHHMSGIKPRAGHKSTKANAGHEKASKQNIGHIRKIQDSKKIIGIQLLTASETKNIPFELMVEFTEEILASKTYYPIFLIAPTKEEREYMEKLNQEFGSSLVSVEADFMALSSVLRNIDLLVTPDTSVKHLADANEIPTIEIALGESPFLKQGTTTRGNLIVSFASNIINSSFASRKEDIINQNTTLDVRDIISCIDYYFLKIDKKTLSQKTGTYLNIYEVAYDGRGIDYRLINHNADTAEIKRVISREIVYRTIMPELSDAKFYTKIANFDTEALQLLISNEKSAVTEVMKDLLGSLRALLKRRDQVNSNEAPTELLKALDKLLSHTTSAHLCAIPVIMFSSEMETLSSGNPITGISKLEKLLYKLKKNVQIIISFMKELENESKAHVNEAKLKDFQGRRLNINRELSGEL